MSNTKTYYHGGYGNLIAGDFVLPPTKTKSQSCADYGAEGICKRDRVYVTTDLNAAILYASFHWRGNGRVYEVEPQGNICHDADCSEEGLSYECDRAKVLSVVQAQLLTPAQRELFVAHHERAK